MPIRQLQVANDSVQDRLLIRIGTQANEEIRIFLTRRFLRELWPNLMHLLNGHLAPQPLEDSAPADEVASFEHPFQDSNPSFPLGANPLLATEAQCETMDDGTARLTLREGRERSYHIVLTAQSLPALCSMLRAANEHAGWDLALDPNPQLINLGVPARSLLH